MQVPKNQCQYVLSGVLYIVPFGLITTHQDTGEITNNQYLSFSQWGMINPIAKQRQTQPLILPTQGEALSLRWLIADGLAGSACRVPLIMKLSASRKLFIRQLRHPIERAFLILSRDHHLRSINLLNYNHRKDPSSIPAILQMPAIITHNSTL